MYWGQLGGALEAINSGTTFVLDHAHGNQTNEHGKPSFPDGDSEPNAHATVQYTANQALSATIASGIRSIFAYSHAPYFTKWDSKTCELSRDIMPESTMDHIFELAKSQPYGNGRVQIGFGFDYWFLPKEAVLGIFTGLRNAGVKLFTSHYAKNPALGELSHLGHDPLFCLLIRFKDPTHSSTPSSPTASSNHQVIYYSRMQLASTRER